MGCVVYVVSFEIKPVHVLELTGFKFNPWGTKSIDNTYIGP